MAGGREAQCVVRPSGEGFGCFQFVLADASGRTGPESFFWTSDDRHVMAYRPRG